MAKQFKALVVSEGPNKSMVREVRTRTTDELPAGEVLVRVHYSGLNYKDALSAIGNRGVTKQYPHTPGIDAAGVVEESSSSAFRAGDEVICTGFDLGMDTDGGFGEYVRVPAGWLVRLPKGMTLKESMIYGTAGFTAALCVDRLLKEGLQPAAGEVVVTGATGGVGSLAVGILARLGYRVIAVTGKMDQKEFLTRLGAAGVVGRDELDDKSGKPMITARWAGAVDTVGGNILATVLKSLKPNSAVACCGLVASPELHTTVFPFILRGASLFGINSVDRPLEHRRTLWGHLAADWKPPLLTQIARECRLEQLEPEIERILKGGQSGRVIVNLT
ncbi:MAG: YhdH/YhfP family quinone oxidoreductase [Sulfurifustaceae bacterium]